MNDQQLKSLHATVKSRADKYGWNQVDPKVVLVALESECIRQLVGMNLIFVRSRFYQAARKIHQQYKDPTVAIPFFENCFTELLFPFIDCYQPFQSTLAELTNFGLVRNDAIQTLIDLCIDTTIDYTKPNPLMGILPAFRHCGLPNNRIEAVAALKGAILYRNYVARKFKETTGT